MISKNINFKKVFVWFFSLNYIEKKTDFQVDFFKTRSSISSIDVLNCLKASRSLWLWTVAKDSNR